MTNRDRARETQACPTCGGPAIIAGTTTRYFIPVSDLIEDNTRLRRAIALARKKLQQEPTSTKPCWQILAEARAHLTQVLALPGEHSL